MNSQPTAIARRFFSFVLCLAALLPRAATAQTLQLDPISVGAAVTVTGSGGPPTLYFSAMTCGSAPGSPVVGTGGALSLDVTAPGPERFCRPALVTHEWKN